MLAMTDDTTASREEQVQTARERALARTAMALMDECRVAPRPANFALFYAYAAGENAALCEAMQALMAAGVPLTEDRLACLRPQADDGATVVAAGEAFAETIDSTLGRLEAVGRHARAYSSTLNAASDDLDAGVQSPAGMRRLLDRLVAATRQMETRGRALEAELQRSSERIGELMGALDAVRRENLTDALTGLPNRKAFDAAVEAIRAAGGALILCDIDHFKRFNDRWGHQTGDQVLREVANCLQASVPENGLAARHGGEEFAILLHGADLARAALTAERIRRMVESRHVVDRFTGGTLGNITVSVGVAVFAPGENTMATIARADACLYAAKRGGRNRVVREDSPAMTACDIAS